MTKRIMISSLVAILILGVTAVAFAAPLGQKLGVRPGICSNLDLSDEQYSKMQTIHENYFEEHQDLRNQISKEIFELKNIYLQKDPDKEAIKQKEDKIEKLREQMNELRNQKFNDVNSILTKEQQEKIQDLRNNPNTQGLRRGMGSSRGFCNGQGQGRGMRGRF